MTSQLSQNLNYRYTWNQNDNDVSLQVDPSLRLIEDSSLVAVYTTSDGRVLSYGSADDEAAATKCLAAIEVDSVLLMEIVISDFLKSCEKLAEVCTNYQLKIWFCIMSVFDTCQSMKKNFQVI